jgi:L-aspartate oxidase
MDMEFMQFHPTALCKDGAPPFLISEAVRGAGGILVDHNGKRFAHRFHQDGELATRDIVARAIHTVIHEHGISSAYLDMRPIGKAQIEHEFPTIQSRCAQYGIDVLKEPIPVSPAAHYFMGGIAADITGKTDIVGLYAIGECASTGLHGANRLASNSLLEAGVMAIRLAQYLLSPRLKMSMSEFAQLALVPECDFESGSTKSRTPYLIPKDISKFRVQMYRHAGLVRSEAGLMLLQREPSIETVAALTPELSRDRNMYEVGMLIARAAMLRRESRGGHFREDYPTLDNVQYSKRLWLSKNGSGWAIPQTDPSAIHHQTALTA